MAVAQLSVSFPIQLCSSRMQLWGFPGLCTKTNLDRNLVIIGAEARRTEGLAYMYFIVAVVAASRSRLSLFDIILAAKFRVWARKN